MLLNCGVGEDSWHFLGQQRDQISQSQEISPECSLEGLMLKLKLQYFGLLMWRTDSLEKTPMLGKIEGRRRRGQQRMRWLDGITDSMDMSLSKLWDSNGQGSLVCCSPWGCKESDMTEWLNWSEKENFLIFFKVPKLYEPVNHVAFLYPISYLIKKKRFSHGR